MINIMVQAIRQLFRAPAFAIAAVLTLAFGIGTNLSVFQVLYSVMLADLPVSHPQELVEVHAARSPFDQEWLVSYAAYERLRASTPDVSLLATTAFDEGDLELPDHALTKATFELVSDNYFGVLGVTPAAGRTFIQDDARQGQSVWPAVLRYDFARNRFGSAQQAVGQRLVLNGHEAVVVGVAHPRFLGTVQGYAPDVWLPLALQSTGQFDTAFDSLGPGHNVKLEEPWYNQPNIFWLTLLARVPAEHRAATAAKWDQVFAPDRELMTEATADPQVKTAALHATTQLVPVNHGRGRLRENFSTPLLLLMALSASIFLVGCLNLANLQLARLNARAAELGIRMALGASRGRLLQQILLEDGLIVLAGSALAFVLGRAAANVLVLWASNRNAPRTLDLHAGLPILLLGAGLILLSVLAFSVLPAVLFLRGRLALVAGSRARVAGIAENAQQRWRANLLLGAQVSLSLLLSTMSACFAATLVHWETVDVGMDREHLLSARVDVARHREDLPELYRQIRERLEALPGVRGAAVGMCGSIHCGWNTALYVHGRSDLTNGQVHGQEDHVSAGYFSTAGIPLLRGRDFSPDDTDKTQAVAILSRSYAGQLFGDANPIGQWVGYEPAPNDHKFLIVGEVADAHLNGAEREAPAMVFMSLAQKPAPIHVVRVRVSGDPRLLAETVRRTLLAVEPTLAINEIVPLSVEMTGDLGTETLLARLAGIYAGLTLLLVAIGFYGVMSSRTARRRNEFGIRLALGASRGNIQWLIVGQTAAILSVGILPGIVLSILGVRAASHLLYGSVERNSIAIVAASAVLALAGSLATIIPARRAAFTDPLESLRSE